MAVLGLVLLTWAAPASAQRAGPSLRRAEGVVALIGGSAPGPGVRVVLESDVTLLARIRLAGRSHGELPLGPLPPPLLRATLDEIVGQLLIVREAERVRVSPPTGRDVATQRAQIGDLAGGETRLRELMRALGVGADDLLAVARRRATVRRFLAANLEGTSVVTEEEVERAYAAGDHPFIGQPLEEVREAMRVYLTRRAVDRAVVRWVSVLRQRTPMRLLAPYAASP